MVGLAGCSSAAARRFSVCGWEGDADAWLLVTLHDSPRSRKRLSANGRTPPAPSKIKRTVVVAMPAVRYSQWMSEATGGRFLSLELPWFRSEFIPRKDAARDDG